MDGRRQMDEFYWPFKAWKWDKINLVSTQVIPEIYDTFSKKVEPNGTIAELLSLIWEASRGTGS